MKKATEKGRLGKEPALLLSVLQAADGNDENAVFTAIGVGRDGGQGHKIILLNNSISTKTCDLAKI